MNIFLLVLQAIPVVLELIKTAEGLFGGKGQGEVKKETVMHGISGALDVAERAGARISPQERVAITEGLSQTVDGTVALFNRAGWPGGTQGPDTR